MALANIEGLNEDAAAAVVRLSRGMANAETIDDKIAFYNLAKKADPKIAVPTDVQFEVFKREQAAEKQKEEITMRANKARQEQERQRQDLIDSGRYDAATIKKIEDEFMTPKGISDYDVAATLYAAANPEPNPTIPDRHAAGASWQMPWQNGPKERTAELLANPRKFALDQAHKVVTELRSKRS